MQAALKYGDRHLRIAQASYDVFHINYISLNYYSSIVGILVMLSMVSAPLYDLAWRRISWSQPCCYTQPNMTSK